MACVLHVARHYTSLCCPGIPLVGTVVLPRVTGGVMKICLLLMGGMISRKIDILPKICLGGMVKQKTICVGCPMFVLFQLAVRCP